MTTALEPTTTAELADAVRQARADRRHVHVVGRQTRAGPAGATDHAACTTISTRALTGIVAHEPGDLTITVRAGMRLDELDAHLAEHKQWLPAPSLGHGSGSVGGWLAVGADSLATLSAGRARDWVIGATVVYGDGRVARGRGRVVKNVAGYDIPRLMVGSLGTLGALAEISFRLAPRADVSTTLVARGPSEQVHDAANALLAKPWAPTFVDILTEGNDTRLVAGFDGWQARVSPLTNAARQLLTARGLDVNEPDDPAPTRARLDAPARQLAPSAPAPLAIELLGRPATLRARLADVARATATPCLHAQRGATSSATLVIPDARTTDIDAVLATARQDGSARVIASPVALNAAQVWGPPPSDFALMQRVKSALDPDGAFLPGRFVGAL